MYNLAQSGGLSMQFANFALAGISGAATTHSHAASLPFVIGGAFGTAPTGTTTPTVNSGATDVDAVSPKLPAGDPLAVVAPAAGFRGALVVWTIDAAGTKRCRSRGFFASPTGDALTLRFPSIPTTEIPVSYYTVKAISTVSGTWTHGSSNWNATGITASAVTNLVGLPLVGAVVLS